MIFLEQIENFQTTRTTTTNQLIIIIERYLLKLTEIQQFKTTGYKMFFAFQKLPIYTPSIVGYTVIILASKTKLIET